MLGRRPQVLGVAAAALATFVFAAPAANAGGAQHASAAGMVFDLGTHAPPPNCPFGTGDLAIAWLDGNAVAHGESNPNGDWGGQTVEGPAVFQVDGTTVYTGHATVWGGGGNNKAGQSEGGLTLTFNGTGPDGALSLHIDGHTTTNNAGTTTADFKNVSVVCS